MSSPLKFLDSSIGRKVIMSLTGLFICLFLIVHVAGNLALFKSDDGLAFNQYSLFMTTFPVIKAISYILYATIVLHVFSGFRLAYLNQKARPTGYEARKDPRSASWASKNMAILGFIILVFLVTHMANFWYVYKFGNIPWKEYKIDISTDEMINGKGTPLALTNGEHSEPQNFTSYDEAGTPIQTVVLKDLYEVVRVAFEQSWLVIFYVIGMIAVAYHLVHGFQSGFQSLGLRHPTYTPVIQSLGVWVFGILIPLLFAAMPVYFFFFK